MTNLPEISELQLNNAMHIVLISLLNSGAESLKMTFENFRDKEANNLGNFEVTVKKLK